MRCRIQKQRYNKKTIKSLIKEMSESKNVSREECFEMENYTVHVRVIDRNEYKSWVKKHGKNDPFDNFSEKVEEEMQNKWSEKEGSWDVLSGWTNRDHEWDNFIEAFYAVYRKEPVVSEGIYGINVMNPVNGLS